MEALQRDLRQANNALKEANAHLEDRVAERTAAIEIANRELKSEINLRQLVSDRLDYLSTHDPLTRLPNHQSFAEAAIELSGVGAGHRPTRPPSRPLLARHRPDPRGHARLWDDGHQ